MDDDFNEELYSTVYVLSRGAGHYAINEFLTFESLARVTLSGVMP